MSRFQVRKVAAGEAEKKNLLAKIPSLKGRKVLIVGDVGLDEYVLGQVRRISPEAPVPVLEVESEDKRLGLAANITQNIASLGGTAWTLGVVGDDAGAGLLKELFVKNGLSWNEMIVDASRPTTRKTRVMAAHHHLVRVDYELTKYLAPEIEAKMLAKFKELLPQCDLVILQDYAKGVVSQTMAADVMKLGRAAGKQVLVDPHRSKGAEFYAGADLLKPNYDEAVALSGLRFDELKNNPDKVYEVGRALQKKAGCQRVVLTRGKDGMTIFSGDEIIEVPTYARKVFDVTGAGDTVIATMSVALAAGFKLEEACQLSNFAAGVVVGKVGSVPCEVNELVDYIQSTK